VLQKIISALRKNVARDPHIVRQQTAWIKALGPSISCYQVFHNNEVIPKIRDWFAHSIANLGSDPYEAGRSDTKKQREVINYYCCKALFLK